MCVFVTRSYRYILFLGRDGIKENMSSTEHRVESDMASIQPESCLCFAILLIIYLYDVAPVDSAGGR